MRRVTPERRSVDTRKTVGGRKAGGKTKRTGNRRNGSGARMPSPRLIAAGVAGIALLGGIGLWQFGGIAEAPARTGGWALSATAGLGLRVQEVLLEGRRFASRSRIATAIGVKRGDPILGVDLTGIRRRLEAVPWIRTATVRRTWPGKIHIVLDERRPIALWQRNRKLRLVDAEGVTLTDRNIGRFRHLLVIVGKDAPSHAPELLDTLETEPALRARVLAAVRVGARRWDIRFKSGVDVRLPERNPTAAWARLAKLERQQGLIGENVEVIDMRLPDRLIVRAKSASPRRTSGDGERT